MGKAATKASEALDPQALAEHATQAEQAAHQARARAEQAQAAVHQARLDAETEFWRTKITEFYAQRRPLVNGSWEAFKAALTADGAHGAVEAWRALVGLRADLRGEHDALQRNAHRLGLRGVRPDLRDGLPDKFADAVDLALAEWGKKRRQRAAKALLRGAEQAAEQGETEVRHNGQAA